MDPSKHLHPSVSTLSTFAGATARLWCFLPTHDMLAIELRSSARTAYLVLTGCSEVCVPVSWASTGPELLFDANKPFAPVTFIDGAAVRIACEGATIQDTDPIPTVR